MECYYCSEIATTEEHVPPQCYFAGIEHEPKKLIKVPACKTHNNDKTKDDEFFRNVISMHVEGGSSSRKLFTYKTLKSLKSTPTKYQEIMSGAKPIIVNGWATGEFEINWERFEEYFQKMANGLYYFNHKTRFEGEFEIISLSFQEYSAENLELRKMIERVSLKFRKIGEYPTIFYFQEIIENSVFYGIRMVFMENITILANNKKIMDEIRS